MVNLPIATPPEEAADELLGISQRAVESVQRLGQADDDTFMTGISEREAVFRNDHMTLYRYRGTTSAPAQTDPLLIVYALVNRPYMLDLQENRSLIRQLLARGQDVYLIDWGYPQRNDRWLTLDDYLNEYLDSCVNYLRETHKLEAVTLLGVCQGGIFSLCYSALHPQKVARLITLATSVDFHAGDGVINRWMQHDDSREMIDTRLVVDALGNVPGSLMNPGFVMLQPFEAGLRKYLTLLDAGENSQFAQSFLRLEKWIFDTPDQAGEAWREFVEQFYVHNKLISGEATIGGQPVNLKRLTMPVLNIYAENDHLVPPASCQAMRGAIASDDYSEAAFPVGHIGMYVSRRVQETLPDLLSTWLAERTASP
jgi:polyhydroxyalkanoate synthase